MGSRSSQAAPRPVGTLEGPDRVGQEGEGEARLEKEDGAALQTQKEHLGLSQTATRSQETRQ